MKTYDGLNGLYEVDHPLVQHRLSEMRDARTGTARFRALLKDIARLMAYPLTEGLDVTTAPLLTPLEKMQAPVLARPEPAIVPILRAGLGMAEGLAELLPDSPIGHIGLYRDPETKRPVEYLVKLPSADRAFILVDPMLATGYSAAAAVDIVKRHGVAADDIYFLSLVAAPEGARTFLDAHPDVPVFTAALDERLDENAYIRPGLGDAGDRLFATDHD